MESLQAYYSIEGYGSLFQSSVSLLFSQIGIDNRNFQILTVHLSVCDNNSISLCRSQKQALFLCKFCVVNTLNLYIMAFFCF